MIDPLWLASIIGILAGLVGVSLSAILQWVVDKPVPAPYVLGFFLVGSALVLINVGVPPTSPPGGVEWLPAVGNVVLLGVELVVFVRLRQIVRAVPTSELVPTADTDG